MIGDHKLFPEARSLAVAALGLLVCGSVAGFSFGVFVESERRTEDFAISNAALAESQRQLDKQVGIATLLGQGEAACRKTLKACNLTVRGDVHFQMALTAQLEACRETARAKGKP